MPVMLAPPGAKVEDRLTALERGLRQVSNVADGALQIPPYMRGGTPGQAIAGGSPLLDPQGLIAVVKSLGQSSAVGAQTFNATGFADVTGSSISFTLARPQTLLLLFLATGKITVGTNNGLVNAHFDGLASSGNLYIGATNYVTVMGWTYVDRTTATTGTHTAKIQAAVDSVAPATTLQTIDVELQVFQLGN